MTETYPTYSFRSTLLEPEKTYTLLPNALVVEPLGGLREEIPFSDIKEVLLSYFNTRSRPRTYSCEMKLSDGRNIALRTMHVKSLMQIEHLDNEYKAFVEALHQRLAEQPGIAFKKGLTPFAYNFTIGLLIFGTVINSIVGYFIATVSLWVGIGILGVFLPFGIWSGIRFLQINRPGVYSPDSLPKDLMPA